MILRGLGRPENTDIEGCMRGLSSGRDVVEGLDEVCEAGRGDDGFGASWEGGAQRQHQGVMALGESGSFSTIVLQ